MTKNELILFLLYEIFTFITDLFVFMCIISLWKKNYEPVTPDVPEV